MLAFIYKFNEVDNVLYTCMVTSISEGFVQLQYAGTAPTLLVDATNDKCAQRRRKKEATWTVC